MIRRPPRSPLFPYTPLFRADTTLMDSDSAHAATTAVLPTAVGPTRTGVNGRDVSSSQTDVPARPSGAGRPSVVHGRRVPGASPSAAGSRARASRRARGVGLL